MRIRYGPLLPVQAKRPKRPLGRWLRVELLERRFLLAVAASGVDDAVNGLVGSEQVGVAFSSLDPPPSAPLAPSLRLVKDIAAQRYGSSPEKLTAVGSTVFFSAYSVAAGQELWKSDGTAAGTVMVKDIRPGPG